MLCSWLLGLDYPGPGPGTPLLCHVEHRWSRSIYHDGQEQNITEERIGVVIWLSLRCGIRCPLSVQCVPSRDMRM